jgi:hypothetical protein
VTRNEATECSPWCPTLGPPVGSALPSPGSAETRSPASAVLWRCATPCAPLAALRCLRLAIPCGAPVPSLPAVHDAQPRAWGSISGPHYRTLAAGRQSGPPRFPCNPPVPMPCSSTPAGPRTPGHCGVSAWPPRCPQRRLPRINPAFEAQSHGFRTRCLRFVRRVATQDAKLASGRWPSATGRAWLPAGLLRKVSDGVILLSRALPGARTS